jgi:hypothetical protein
MKQLAMTLPKSSLLELSLADNRIGSPGCEELANAVVGKYGYMKL